MNVLKSKVKSSNGNIEDLNNLLTNKKNKIKKLKIKNLQSEVKSSNGNIEDLNNLLTDL